MITGLLYGLAIPLTTGGQFPERTAQTKSKIAQGSHSENEAPDALTKTPAFVAHDDTGTHICLTTPPRYDYGTLLLQIETCKNLYDAQNILMNHGGFYLPKKSATASSMLLSKYEYDSERAQLPDHFLQYVAHVKADKITLIASLAAARGNLGSLFSSSAWKEFLKDSFSLPMVAYGILETEALYAFLSRYAPEKPCAIYAALIGSTALATGIIVRAARNQKRVRNKIDILFNAIGRIQIGAYKRLDQKIFNDASADNATHLRIKTLNTSELIG